MTDKRICKVLAHWDAEANYWVATSHDVKGLAVGGANEAELIEKLKFVIPDLLKANLGENPYSAFEIDFIRSATEEMVAA